MALDTYNDLITTAMAYAEDITPEDPINRFVQLAEAELNVILKHRHMETEVTLTTEASAVSIPADFIEARLLSVDGLIARPVSAYGAKLMTGEVGYYQVGNTIKIVPEAEATRYVRIVYYKRLDPLTDESVPNWLLLNFPMVYLHSVLVQAARYRDNERLEAQQSALLDKSLALVMEDNARSTQSANPIVFDGGW